ncbi:MAG: EAL domain-containing protein [Drouetiella hepatica Uher 2000/2452]|jgi:diguanylate cyclase (GGDEF)-like protein|uniref:EAL domain-containing protein n=1 Tax=Drouetiella hepatica Uher 2000/2452 TaxID=904376 RepID=A0A951UKY7_9CYAN|nr:EAL domain-containing protein [Drouetiella hepatica Uher 2000/2452]
MSQYLDHQHHFAQQERSPKEDILIVDDTPENLRLLSTILIRQGYGVRKAINGKIALMAAQTVQPDLILLDIMMPEMNGYEVCQHLKANPQTNQIPVIFLSALSEGNDKAKAFSVGGADYITKPFQLEEVLARVKQQITLRSVKLKNQKLTAELEQRVQERTHQLELANQELKQEINERQLLQTQLMRMALHDALTQLPNRSLFMQRLETALKRIKDDAGGQIAVLFLDCDRFKLVNDSLGHLAGDELLIAIGRRLATLLSPRDTLARLGGDEFAILIDRSNSFPLHISKLQAQLADQILEALTHPFQLEHHEVFINASIGVAIGDSSYSRPEHLLRDADTAMYRAKASGKAQYQVFAPAMHAATLELLQLETDLRRALQHNEFVCYYQPIIDLTSGKIVGFEALIRWQHPQRGLVMPGAFIPTAEEVGLIYAIGNWALKAACQQLYRWQKDYPDAHLSMSVNISARQFTQPDLVQEIDQILLETQLDPQYLKLEITESALMDNARSAVNVLQQLRARKIQLSIDDFGTGYSSLSYLHAFPIDTLKIDRSFVQRMDSNLETTDLIPLIINIAQTMGMNVTGEGIETSQQLAQLRALGCNFGQGFLFSEALAAQEATQLIAQSPRW